MTRRHGDSSDNTTDRPERKNGNSTNKKRSQDGEKNKTIALAEKKNHKNESNLANDTEKAEHKRVKST